MNILNTRTLNSSEEKALFLNPMIKKLSKVDKASAEASTYAGIFAKFVYFLLMIVAGIALALIFKGAGGISVEAVTDELLVSRYAVIAVLASAVIFLVFPLLAFIFRKTIPFFGALYCVSIGYLFGFILALEPSFNGYMLLALTLTVSVVTAMGILYFRGRIRVTNKFRAVTSTLFASLVLSASALAVCLFIPSLRGSVQTLIDNPIVSVASSVGGIIIASLFLLIDFDAIHKTVQDKLPREYEWFAAFSVVFTVIWLYLKVLDLVSKIQST